MGSIGPVDILQDELDRVLLAVQRHQAELSNAANFNARYSLMAKANNLLQTIRGPADMVFANFEDASKMGAIRSLLEGGVLQAMPTGGKSISADELALKTGVDKALIVRLMRAVTPVGPVRETGEEQYAHTPFSEIYLAPQMQAVYNMMADEFIPSMLRNYDWQKQNGWKHRYTLHNNPYTTTMNCQGETMFEHISKFPDRFTRFNDAMQGADSSLMTVDLYPFGRELGKLASDDTVTLVDVGGGRGHITRQIKETFPGLKGRFILQDKPSVIEDNGKEIKSHGIEAMGHDFFNPQPVKGALAYYIRRCLHDWPDEPEARTILSNLAGAMDREKSRVLITEFIVPAEGGTMFHAWMDHTMMTFGGIERTEKDWANLLDRSGLQMVKVWRLPGVPTAVIEARLK